MTIYKKEGCDYSVMIADLMITLDSLKKFIVKFWIGTVEVPYEYEEDSDFEFLQEGIKITTDGKSTYLWYDTITTMEIIDES